MPKCSVILSDKFRAFNWWGGGDTILPAHAHTHLEDVGWTVDHVCSIWSYSVDDWCNKLLVCLLQLKHLSQDEMVSSSFLDQLEGLREWKYRGNGESFWKAAVMCIIWDLFLKEWGSFKFYTKSHFLKYQTLNLCGSQWWLIINKNFQIWLY